MLGGVGVERLGWAKGEMQTVQHGVYLDVADVPVAQDNLPGGVAQDYLAIIIRLGN